jgi:ganglioside GM2 activator
MLLVSSMLDFVSQQIETLIYKKAGNEYRKTPFHIGPDKLCEYLEKDSVFYEDLLKVSDIPNPGVCPWPKKKYNFEGFLIPLDKIPDHMEDDWMAEMKISRNGELVNGYQLYVTISRV